MGTVYKEGPFRNWTAVHWPGGGSVVNVGGPLGACAVSDMEIGLGSVPASPHTEHYVGVTSGSSLDLSLATGWAPTGTPGQESATMPDGTVVIVGTGASFGRTETWIVAHVSVPSPGPYCIPATWILGESVTTI